MNETAVKALMAEIAPVIRDYVNDAAEQMVDACRTEIDKFSAHAVMIQEENDDLKQRLITLEEKSKTVVEIELSQVENLIEAEFAKRTQPEVNMESIVNVILQELPKPEKGEPGENGKNADPEEIQRMVNSALEGAITDIPTPNDGKDGRGIRDLIIDRDGHLVATLDDGEMKNLGPVIGKDGNPGKDGRDGFSLDDFDIDKGDDGRTFVLKFDRGDTRHEYELTFPFPVYRGVFKEGEQYEPGDICTWGGHAWHCDKETTGKPDAGDWTLMVKRGRDGKDAKVGG